MGHALAGALRKLCDEIGWSYAVFWKAIGAADPVHLVWDDGYCGNIPQIAGLEACDTRHKQQHGRQDLRNGQLNGDGNEVQDHLYVLVKKVMASEVHVVGEGIVGQAAFTGNHHWISDSLNDHGFVAQGASEMNHHFLAGIQTIVVIPVLPRGVLQLGSTHKVMENIALVHQAKKLCSQLTSRSAPVTSATVHGVFSQQDHSRSSVAMLNNSAADVHRKDAIVFPITADQRIRADSKDMPITTSLNADANACLLNVVKHNGGAVRQQLLYSNADASLGQQLPYYDKQAGSPIHPAVMNSEFTSYRLKSVGKQPLLMTNIGLLGSAKSAESAADEFKTVLSKSLGCYNPIIGENLNVSSLHEKDELLNTLSSHGRLHLLADDASVIMSNSHNAGTKQKLGRTYSMPGSSLHNHPPIPNKDPHCLRIAVKVKSATRDHVHAPAALSSDDFQISCGGSNVDISQRIGLSSLNHPIHGQKPNETMDHVTQSMPTMKMDGSQTRQMPIERTFPLPSEVDLFDMLGPEFHQLYGNLDSSLFQDDLNVQSLRKAEPKHSTCPDSYPVFSTFDDEFCHSEIFSLADTDQLLDAVVSNVNISSKQNSGDIASCKTSLMDIPSSYHTGSSEQKQSESSVIPPVLVKNGIAIPSCDNEEQFFEKVEKSSLSQSNGIQKSQIRLWIESGQNMKCDSVSASNSKGLDTTSKPNRKRSRPGENSRPRPKDRQLIQDRIKELRELVPNGAKCSIDALLEKTIKHMLFLQSVTKHADKLKDSAESKILGNQGGMLPKDYSEGGTTWAFEVGARSMTCPIIVEDLDRPRQMLVEMLCEDRGIFLEIADFIRGLGLTILRGVMEARKSKIWARFTVEANRDVTRMEIFLSLVRLLEPNGESSGVPQNVNNMNMPHGMVHQPIIPATGVSDRLR